MVTVRVKSPPCVVCGKQETVVLDAKKYYRWMAGENAQNVWPEMTPDNRELLISGTHPACWEKMFAEQS